MKRILAILFLLLPSFVAAENTTRLGQPAERERGLVFMQDFGSQAEVERDNGTVTGAPTFSRQTGVEISSGNYVSYALTGDEFNSVELSFVYEFIPTVAADSGTEFYLFDETAGFSNTFRHKSDGQIDILFGASFAAQCTLANYQAYWNVGERNVFVFSGTSGANKLYLNGNDLALVSASRAWTPAQSTALFVGVKQNGTVNFNASVVSFRVFHAKLTAAEASDYYEEDTFTYMDDATAHWQFRLQDHDPSNAAPELLEDNDMEKGGVADWTAFNAAVLSKQTDSPQNGDRYLRVAYGGTNNPYARQLFITAGKHYHVTGWAKGDGTFAPWLRCSSVIWEGTTSTSWQAFDFVFTAASTVVDLGNYANASGYSEFDNITVKETLLEDGDMEDDPATNFSVGNNADITQQTGTRTGGTGTDVLRVAYNGTNSPYAWQGIITAGKTYKVTGWTRGDGTKWSELWDSGFGPIWTGISSTDWQYFNLTFTAVGTQILLLTSATASGYAEWDDVIVEEKQERTLDSSGNENHLLLGDGSTVTTFPTKTEKHGYTMDGGNYFKNVSMTGKLNSTAITFVVVFKPEFATDENSVIRIYESGTALHYSIYKHNNALSNLLYVYLGGTQIALIAEATYSPYWLKDQWNVLVVSGDSDSDITNAWLNQGHILVDDTTAWTSTDPTQLWIGSDRNSFNNFTGSMSSVQVYPFSVSTLQMHDLTIRARQMVNQK